jgi:membrane protein YqaA with SNARE-associated domain
MEKKTVAMIVKSTIFQRIFFAFAIFFIVLTYFISVTPDSFLVYGYFGVFLYNIFSTSLLIMPILVDRMDLFGIIFFSALGNVPNTSINYLVGNTSKNLYAHNKYATLLKHWMRKYGVIVVYLVAIVPLPVDINGLLAGYVGIPFKKYIVVNFLGRATSFLLAGLGIWTFSQILKLW